MGGSRCNDWDNTGDWCFMKKGTFCHESSIEEGDNIGRDWVNDMGEPLMKSKVRCAYGSPKQQLKRRKTENVCKTFKRIIVCWTVPQMLLTMWMVLVMFKFISNACCDKEKVRDAEFAVGEEDPSDLEDELYDDLEGFSDDEAS